MTTEACYRTAVVPAPDPFATRLSLLTGKGGVGKTTVVAGLAVEAARRGGRPLIVELGHRASMQAVFGVPEVGHAPTQVAEGVHATNIDLDESLRDYVADHVPLPALARRIAESRSLARFFEAAPAVGEVLTLQRIEQLLEGPWDPVLVDFDATGHALMFLELPRVFEGLDAEGPVRRLLDSFSALLSDPERTRLHLVTLPGRLPVQETIELHARLEREHAVRLGVLFANRVPRPPSSAAATVDAWRARLPADHPAQVDLSLLERAIGRSAAARAQLERLRAAVPLPLVELPDQPEHLDLDALGRLAGGPA